MPNLTLRQLRTQWSQQKGPRTVLLASLAVIACFAGWRQVGTSLESLEIYARDRMLRLRPELPPDERLLVVGVSEPDIQRYGYPLPDQVIAQLLTRLLSAQPRTVGLDIIRDLPQGEGRPQLLATLQDSRTVGVCKVGLGDDIGYPPPPDMPKSRLGFSNFPADPGGMIRRGLIAVVPPGAAANPCQDPSEPVFSLGFQLARQYLDNAGIPLSFTANDEIQLGSVVFAPLLPTSGGYQHADTGGYQMLLQYRSGFQVAKQVSLSQVLEGQIGPEQIRDRIILIGYVAESVHDLFPTPHSAGENHNRPMPGVLIHAHLTSQVLGAVLDQQPLPWFWPQWAELGWIGFWAVIGGALAGLMRHPLLLGVGMMAGLGLCLGAGYVAFSQGGWIVTASPALALVITFSVVGLVDRYAQTLSKKIKKIFNLNIDLDQEEIQQKASEIVGQIDPETIERGQQLRQQRSQQPPSAAPATPPTHPDGPPAPPPSDSDSVDDFFQQFMSGEPSERPRSGIEPTTNPEREP